MLPGMLSRLSTRDTWLTRNAPGNALSVENSGHVACSEGFRTGLTAWALRARGALERLPEGGSRCGLGDTWHSTKGFRRRSFGRACSEGVPKGGAFGWGF